MNKGKLQEAVVGQIEAEENLVIDVQFVLQERIFASKLTRKQVADLAGMTTKRLSRLMSPEGNPDLKTVARLFFVLGKHVKVGLKSHKVAAAHKQVAALTGMTTKRLSRLMSEGNPDLKTVARKR